MVKVAAAKAALDMVAEDEVMKEAEVEEVAGRVVVMEMAAAGPEVAVGAEKACFVSHSQCSRGQMRIHL